MKLFCNLITGMGIFLSLSVNGAHELLIAAAKSGNLSAIKDLADKGVDIHEADDYGPEAALRIAAWAGHFDIVQYLVIDKADVNAGGVEISLRTSSCGRSEVVRLSPARCSSIKMPINAALISASGRNHIEIVRYLLAHGADVHIADQYGYDAALTMACLQGHYEIAALLIEHGAKVHASDENGGEAPLRMAAWGGHAEIVGLLLSNRANIHAADCKGADAPLRIAAKNGHRDVVKLLLDRGADISAADGCGPDAPLRMASFYSYVEIVTLLFEKLGVFRDAKDYQQRLNNGLVWACAKGYDDVARLLLCKGADVHAADDCGPEAAIRAAARCGYASTVALLIGGGADIHAADSNGPEAALREACLQGHVDVVELLLVNDAYVNAIDSTTLGKIAAQGYGGVLSCLRNHQ